MTSHPNEGKAHGREGERRSDMLRSIRETVEEMFGLNDSRGVRTNFRRLNSCLFSMLLRCLINRTKRASRVFVSDRSNHLGNEVAEPKYHHSTPLSLTRALFIVVDIPVLET